MRLVLATAVMVTAGAVAVVTLSHMADPLPASAAPQTCQATIGPISAGGKGQGKTDAAKLDGEQQRIAAEIMSIGSKRNLSSRAWQIAIQAGMTESGLRNVTYGDRDSLGIFQMRPSMGWGSPQQVTDVEYAINKFYSVLEDVPGWETMRPGNAAQAVERSAFPDRYHQWEAMAVYLVGHVGEVADPSGCANMASGSKAVGPVIEAARSQLGERYAWGGGGPSGPGPGTGVDAGVVGFDCSALMQYAWAKAGVTLPRVSREQFRAGAPVPFSQAEPGDLVFWAYNPKDPATIHHVALYLGHNQVIHAPESGDVVKISTIWRDELLSTVVRPGARST